MARQVGAKNRTPRTANTYHPAPLPAPMPIVDARALMEALGHMSLEFVRAEIADLALRVIRMIPAEERRRYGGELAAWRPAAMLSTEQWWAPLLDEPGRHGVRLVEELADAR